MPFFAIVEIMIPGSSNKSQLELGWRMIQVKTIDNKGKNWLKKWRMEWEKDKEGESVGRDKKEKRSREKRNKENNKKRSNIMKRWVNFDDKRWIEQWKDRI